MSTWRNSFITRYAGLSASLIVAVVLISGWLRDRAARRYFVQDQQRHLAHRLEIIRVRLNSAIDGIRKDILYFSQSPAFARLATAPAGGEREAARQEASMHFRGGVQARPNYFQARLIGLADGGRELMRFDQAKGQVREASAEELQPRGNQDYFRETLKLPVGKLCFSEFNLNQDLGHLTEPHVPTLNASTPVADREGRLLGLVIVKVDATALFHELRELAGPDIILILSNGKGDYLLHPDPEKCFGFEQGRRCNLFDDHPQLRHGSNQARLEDDPLEISITDEVPFTWECDHSLILRLALPKNSIMAPLRAQRAQNLVVTGGLATLAGAVVIVLTHLFARNLRRVADAVGHYEPGKPLPVLPPDSQDEVGLLTRKFRQMASKISEQIDNLHEARQRAEAATRARDEFLATMSHEIRTPMNAVLGMTHVLETECRDPQQARRLQTLKFAGRQLMALLNNLLDHDRIQAGAIALEQVDFDFVELLENLQRSLDPLASRKGLSFLLQLDERAARWVRGDPVRLYQILNNLVHNAIKFTQTGQVMVRVKPGLHERVCFEISDTGPGLPAAVLDRLGPAFREKNGIPSEGRFPASAKTGELPKDSGGLGLLISKRLIELLGGEFSVESAPTGTKLSFYVPLPPASANESQRSAENLPDLRGFSALVIEDVPSNQTVIGALLEKTGIECDFAGTGAEARALLRSRIYDFIFLDIQLPDGNGADLAAEIMNLRPESRILAVSAQVSQEVRCACEAAGVKEFIPKPLEPADLYSKLARLTEPRLDSIARLFDHDELKISSYFQQLDTECEAWEQALRLIAEARDNERLARLHHQMKNAIRQLGLWKLDLTLDQLREALTNGKTVEIEELLTTALRLLARLRQLTGEKRLSTSSR